jgi:hypothetical protein
VSKGPGIFPDKYIAMEGRYAYQLIISGKRRDTFNALIINI